MGQLGGRWSNKVVKAVRSIIKDGSINEKQKVDALRSFADETGLIPPERPTPLKAVTKDEIRVICWMAVVPEKPKSISLVEQIGQFNLGDTL